jgi:hypothetical protein
MAIAHSPISTVPTTVYTAEGNSAVTTMYICNRSPITVTANVFVVPYPESLDANNIIYSNLAIASNDTYVMDFERILLSNADALIMTCSSVNSLVATVSYVGI